ncbi:MAG: hypothetical protein LH466_03140 [Sphingomonas bacterium]|nr:hypothetical protein [Sphingomonas bacterium]
MNKQLTMTTAMAAALIALPGCSSNNGWDDNVVADRDVAVCVDQEGKRVEDRRCNEGQRSVGSGLSSGLLWYYIGRNSAVPYYGDSVRQGRYAGAGAFTPRAGASYFPAPARTSMTRSQAVSRGGLGSSGRRFGSGRS